MSQLLTLSRNQRERLCYLEFCLYFLGEIRRSDLMANFEVAPAVATRDIAQYKLLAERNLLLHQPSKTYRITSDFQPIFDHKLEQVMASLLQNKGYGVESLSDALLPCEYPVMLNRPKLSILAAVTRAIHAKKLLKINYYSTTSSEQSRVIAPFAIVDTGLRWHTRAYDRLRERFIDLVITRILKAEVLEETPQRHELPANDNQWNRIVELELIPHPGHGNPEIARLDYGMTDDLLKLNVRAANAGYMLRRWSVDCSAGHTINDPAYRLCLANPAALYGVQSATLAPGFVEKNSP